MLSFEITYGEMPDIKSLEQGFWKWMSAIEIDRDCYDVTILSGSDSKAILGRLEVSYKHNRLFDAVFYKKYEKAEGGKGVIHGMFTIRCMDEGMELIQPGKKTRLNINDKLDVNYHGKQTHIVAALHEVLPIRDEKEVEKIVEVLDVTQEHIKMDSYQKRYVIDSPIPELDWKEDLMPNTFYKYISLEVFHKMLLSGTFRMNSIVSQSDTQESFYLGDFVCRDYENEFKRFNGILSEQTVLISSFTTKYDDEYLWEEYGDKGRGVCLCFCMTGEQKLRQIQYINKETTSLWRFKKAVDQLKEENIHIHFSEIDDWHRFVKDDKYIDEDEWRLVIDYKGDVDYDLYGHRCVSYKDFPFIGKDLPEIGLSLQSVLIGPNQPSGTSNFPLLTKRIYNLFGDEVIVNRSEVSQSLG